MALKLRSLNRGLGAAGPPARAERKRACACLAPRGPTRIPRTRIAKRSSFITTSRTSSTSSGWIEPWFIPAVTSSMPLSESTMRSRPSSSTSAASCCLQPGERFLDIGCGWGALVIHAARHHGVRAHGITLSSNQLEIARARIAAAGTRESGDGRAARLSRPARARRSTTRWRASACSSTWDSRTCPCISIPCGGCSSPADCS